MEKMKDKSQVFIDTNILVFANVKTSVYHEKAKFKLIELVETGAELFISNQTIREYLAVLSRPDFNGHKIPNDILINDLYHLREEYIVLFENNQTLDNLQMLYSNCMVGGKQIHDANIVATMLNFNINLLLTHNVDDFSRFSDYISIITI